MENEFFSMLLNFDSGSFQSVPDIRPSQNQANHHHHHVEVVNTNKNLTNSTHMSNVTKNLLTPNQISFNDVSGDGNNYPLDMQFPNILRASNEKEKKVAKKTKSTPKKRKQELSAELEQTAKVFKTQSLPGDDFEDFEKDSDQEESSKRQRRLVKNREAAQLFRQRQKAYIQNLEKKVNDLNFENQQHRSKVELLTTENRLLADQLTYLRSFISGVISIAFPNGQPHNLAAMLPPFDLPPNPQQRIPDMPRSGSLDGHPLGNPKEKLN